MTMTNNATPLEDEPYYQELLEELHALAQPEDMTRDEILAELASLDEGSAYWTEPSVVDQYLAQVGASGSWDDANAYAKGNTEQEDIEVWLAVQADIDEGDDNGYAFWNGTN